MRKYFAVVTIALVVSCTQEHKNEQLTEEDNACVSKKLSNQQKADNNLFLNFYYGMTPREFNQAQQELLKSRQLVQYDSTGALPHPDSTVKFLLVINNNGPEKCFFTITPDFEDCILHAINLEYIPSFGSTAYFKESGKSQEVPDLTTANSLEKIFREKYGKPVIEQGHFLGGYNKYLWIKKSKEVNLYKSFGTTQDLRGNDFRRISGIRIEYRSREFDRRTKLTQDSTDAFRNRQMLEQAENGKKSI